jgi:predicted acyl esterase
VEPGAIYELEVPLQAMAYRFRAGSRLRLEVANHDSPQTDGQFMHYYKPSKIGTDTIYHDRRHRSRLIIPVRS